MLLDDHKSYTKGLVSVVIPTYKRSDKLPRAVDSVLNQTYKNVEVLIVDDNVPGDEYSMALEKYFSTISDKRVKLIKQEKHINGAAARNAGIKVAEGEYISFLDDDDWIESVKFEHQIKYLSSKEGEWGGVSCLARSYKNNTVCKVNLPHKEDFLSQGVITRMVRIGTASPLLKRAALDKTGYFDPNLKRMQDIQLFAQFCNKYRLCIVKEYLYNRDIDDKSNQPPIANLVTIKDAFFKSIDDVMQTFPEKQRKRIYIMTRFDMAYNYWKAGMKKEALKNAVGVFRNPVTFRLAIKRLISQIKETKFKNYYLKKYSIDV